MIDKYPPYIGIAFGKFLHCPCIPYQLAANGELFSVGGYNMDRISYKCKWREEGDIIQMKLDLNTVWVEMLIHQQRMQHVKN